jgi:hypothetical protein
MTDAERAEAECSARRSLGARLAAGDELIAAEFDEYMNLAASGVPAVAAR